MIRSPVAILAVLTALNLLNYMDRQLVAAVLPRIEETLGLSHFQGGLLATVFLVGFFATSPIFGELGDRRPRKTLIALGVFVWSAATFATGLAEGPTSLFLARAVVGVGEASYATLAPTILDDVVPPEKRARYLAVFYLAIPVGSAIGYVFGGVMGERFGWRSPFFYAGGPGMLLAFVCMLLVEPSRPAVREGRPRMLEAWAAFRERIPYRRAVLGYCAFTFALGGFAFWAPSFVHLRYGTPLGKASFTFGIVTVVTGLIGTLVGGALGDRATRARRAQRPDEGEDASSVRANLRLCAITAIIGTPAGAAAFLARTPTEFYAGIFVSELLLFASTSPINVVLLRSVPPAVRASAMALSIFAIHLLGDLWSPPLVGLLADHIPIALAAQLLPLAVVVAAIAWWLPETTPAPEARPQAESAASDRVG
jgi:MFS family permease